MSSGFKIIRLTEEDLSGAIEVLRHSFFTEEKICCCVSILEDSPIVPDDSIYKCTVGSKELENLAIDSMKDGVSLVGVDERTGEVLGVAFNKIQVKPPSGELGYFEEFAKNHFKDSSSLGLVDFMVDVDSRVDLFDKYETDCIFEIMFLAVKSTAKGRGIGTNLVTESVKLAQDLKDKNEGKKPTIDLRSPAKENSQSDALGAIPKCVSAIFTSRFSQRCGSRSGFEEVLKVPYTEFHYKGRSYADVTGPDHPFTILEVKRLN